MIFLVLAAALAGAETPAPPTAAAPPVAAAPTRAKDPNRKVCKGITPLGSRLPQSYCMTAAQWEERERRDREMLEKSQRETDPFYRTPAR